MYFNVLYIEIIGSLIFFQQLQRISAMGLLGKVMIITCGVFLGGGIGFYLKETYYVRQRKDKCYELQEELKVLSNVRKEKEKQLNAAWYTHKRND